ncbi:hypothetical protein [Streptomyces sp. cmx-18-6]|uniref:hypothetical protein n=1 Tax=Streptomyces sp. cmx-18-6 TaxID=2790930 RepID=UPI0039817C5B
MQWIARQKFHRTSTAMRGWGAVLLLAACAAWARLAYLLTDVADVTCYESSVPCSLTTAWPEQLTLLAVSVPLSVLGTALFVAGAVRRQTSAHVLEVIEMQRVEERRRQEQARLEQG